MNKWLIHTRINAILTQNISWWLFRTVIQGEVNLIIVSEIYIENIINIMKQKTDWLYLYIKSTVLFSSLTSKINNIFLKCITWFNPLKDICTISRVSHDSLQKLLYSKVYALSPMEQISISIFSLSFWANTTKIRMGYKEKEYNQQIWWHIWERYFL